MEPRITFILQRLPTASASKKKNSFSSTVHPLAVNAIANVKEEALLLKLKRLQSPADLALALPCVSTRQ